MFLNSHTVHRAER